MGETYRKASSLPPLGKRHHSYIEKSMQLLDAGCQENNALKIDGYFGDYRMKLFRLKDKKHYANNIRSVFTSTFNRSLMPSESLDQEVRGQIEEIIKSQRHREEYENEILQRDDKKKEVVYSKGDMIKTLQQDEHLLYSYIPEYQRNRWFQIKDTSKTNPNNTLQQKSVNKIKKGTSLNRKKNKYMFAYLQKFMQGNNR